MLPVIEDTYAWTQEKAVGLRLGFDLLRAETRDMTRKIVTADVDRRQEKFPRGVPAVRSAGYVNVLDVVEFTARCIRHGVPVRIAYQRAARHFDIDVKMVRSVCATLRP